MDLNTLGAVQVKIVVKLRGQHIAYRDYTQAQTICKTIFNSILATNLIIHCFIQQDKGTTINELGGPGGKREKKNSEAHLQEKKGLRQGKNLERLLGGKNKFIFKFSSGPQIINGRPLKP